MTTVEKQKSDVVLQYLRPRKKFPSVWCPGCGNGIVMGAFIRAIDKLGYSKDEIESLFADKSIGSPERPGRSKR